jgi:hypothetical protein
MQLESQPAHGTLDANSEGAFTYTPEAGFVGTDTFLYRAVSSGWLSEPTLVSILVRDATAPTVGALAPQKWVNKQVTVTLTATDDSDVAALEYRDATDVPWIEYIDPFAVTAQGKTSFGIRSRDIFGNAKRSGFAVRIDTVKPVPRAPYTASVTSGGTCRLKYRINDARPGSPDARVVITIKNAGGRVVWTRSYFGKPVNQALKASFRCNLARGAYRFFVTCMDTAGNRQSKAAVNRLTVR